MAKDDKTEQLLRSLDDALKVGQDTLAQISEPKNLLDMTLKGLIEASLEHAAALIDLSENTRVRSSKILLRTMMEGWFVAKYIADDARGGRAESYVSKETLETRKYLQSFQKMADESPNEARELLASTGLESREELDERLERQEEYVEELRALNVKAFPTIYDCAKETGLESTYRSVYGYLFSQQVHLRAGDTLRQKGGSDRRRGESDKVLLTALYLVVQMLALASDQFGSPSTGKLDEFNAVLVAAQ